MDKNDPYWPMKQLWRRFGIGAIAINVVVIVVDTLWLLMATAETHTKVSVGVMAGCAVVGLVAAIDMVRKPRAGKWWPLVIMGAGTVLGLSQSYYVIGMTSL